MAEQRTPFEEKHVRTLAEALGRVQQSLREGHGPSEIGTWLGDLVVAAVCFGGEALIADLSRRLMAAVRGRQGYCPHGFVKPQRTLPQTGCPACKPWSPEQDAEPDRGGML